MSITDPIADMLTKIRNAVKVRHKDVLSPLSGTKKELARILKEEGYIKDFSLVKDDGKGFIKIQLKYSASKKSVITNIKRVSKPGLRVYVGKEEIPKVLNGLGISIVSTSKGLMTDRAAREQGVGGELLCTIY